jgi:hypothetical protein
MASADKSDRAVWCVGIGHMDIKIVGLNCPEGVDVCVRLCVALLVRVEGEICRLSVNASKNAENTNKNKAENVEKYLKRFSFCSVFGRSLVQISVRRSAVLNLMFGFSYSH